MPSLFSRSRTNSTPKTPKKPSFSNLISLADDSSSPYDEFGRAASRSSNRGVNVSVAGKKEKKKADKLVKSRTTGSPVDRYDDPNDLSQIPDGSFLPLNLDRPTDETGVELPKEHDYGYLSYDRHVILGLEEVARLVDIISGELGARGLTTPFIFSTTALDLSSNAIKRLIKAFLNTCANPSPDAERLWREEARLAGPHELGMCLRWGLARVVRVVGGQDYRGFVAWEHYLEFRDTEAALNYPPAHFQTFLPALPPLLCNIILTLLSLLTRLTAHSASSGHTPPTLSPLFAPLFFGLGPPTLAFHHTYHHYLRAANAMEHVLLAFIRWQDAPYTGSDINTDALHGSATALGVPRRLKDWIRGYPSMLPFLHERHKSDRPQARRGARTVRVVNVRRNVRMYSPDLVKTAASWGQRPKSTSDGRGLAGSKEWERVTPPTLKLPPRYSEAYKKRMDMSPNFHPDLGLSSVSASSSTSSSTASTLPDDGRDSYGLGIGLLGAGEGGDRYKNLTDMKWGEFEAMGFGDVGNEKKLQFDLTEGARTARAAKRSTLSWNDFSNSGFSRSDAPLNATLQFSTPVLHTISSWPSHNVEISKKLKKTQRALPAFGWDTEPVMGAEEVIEEAFVNVFCDLVYGGGWMDLERGEEIDRECNWALIEFKSLPIPRTNTVSGVSDPRTSTTLILFEEFVPLEYRQQLALTCSSRRRLPSLFSPGKSKQWKQAATLNGRPYVVGHVPHSPSYREVEFEGLLHGNGSATKVISLDGSKASTLPAIRTTPGRPPTSPLSVHTGRPTTPRKQTPLPPTPRMNASLPATPVRSESPKKMARFRLPGGIPVPSPGGNRKSGMVPAEYSTVDFETRLAGYSDDELNGGKSTSKDERRRSKDDAWVDILVATHNRRMEDAELRKPNTRGLRGGRSDPELASQEVAQALAGVRARSPLSDDESNVMEAVSPNHLEQFGMHDRDVVNESNLADDESEEDADIDSVVSYPRVPRRMGYFDLHPERRPESRTALNDEARTMASYESDIEPLETVYVPRVDDQTHTSPDNSPQSPGSSTDHVRPSDFPQPPGTELPKIVTPEMRNYSAEASRSKPDLVIPPITPADVSPLKPIRSPGKTAALIELYRQREQESSQAPSSSTPSTPQSRLPVRTAASLQPRTPSPTKLPPPPKTPSPPPTPEPEPELELEPLEPPQTSIGDKGLATPPRYVHGAPLHNVIEEEEEEEY